MGKGLSDEELENEQVRLTNQAYLCAAFSIMRQVVPGDEWGITDDECVSIMKPIQLIYMRMLGADVDGDVIS